MKASKHGIKLKLCVYFLVFTAINLILLWFFQTIFLDSFYKSIKTRNIKSCADTIASNIDSVDLQTIIDNLAVQNDVCIRILDEKFSDLYNAQRFPDCVIHKMNAVQLQKLYDQAKNNNNVFSEVLTVYDIRYLQPIDIPPAITDRNYLNNYNNGGFSDKGNGNSNSKQYLIPNTAHNIFDQNKFHKDGDISEDLIFVQISEDSQNTERLILLNSNITPVTATVETIRVQLIIITIILGLFSIILSVLLSRRISKPIIKTNTTAKELAKGNYDISFEGGSYREISELNQTLNFAANELSQVDKLRRELIANISHDLRTPLTMIEGYSEMMRDIPGENTPENLQIVIDETARLTNLVSDILDLSKIQSGTQTLSLKNFNLTQSIRNILKRYSKLIEQDGYVIKFISNADTYVNADEIKISQVVYNLINNAINYTGDDKTVIVKQVLKEGVVRIEITDSGKGIEPEMIKNIWDRYYKIDKSHKQAVIGSGIGLSIVKSIMDMHKAPYGVVSKLGEGSTFWFELNMVTF